MMNTSGNGAAHEYRRNNTNYAVESANPHRLIQLMMEGVLSKIAMARGHMQRAATGEKGSRIGDAIGIISGLRASLNHDADARLSANFDALYDYMARRLLEANLRDDLQILDEVSGLMRELKEAWDAVPAEVAVAGKGAVSA